MMFVQFFVEGNFWVHLYRGVAAGCSVLNLKFGASDPARPAQTMTCVTNYCAYSLVGPAIRNNSSDDDCVCAKKKKKSARNQSVEWSMKNIALDVGELTRCGR